MIGSGRPSSSHYFIGTQGPYFFYLDPHQTRPALPLPANVDDYLETDVDSIHTRRVRRIHVKEMDPSMLIAFIIRDEEDWRKWRKEIETMQGKAVIRVADKNPASLGLSGERDGAIDDVESFDDDDDDDTVLNA
jgi:cysteine protease ATG4